VIQGWDKGRRGPCASVARRQLTIPANLAYGRPWRPGGVIKPGETLVFVVDLLGRPLIAGTPSEPIPTPSGTDETTGRSPSPITGGGLLCRVAGPRPFS